MEKQEQIAAVKSVLADVVARKKAHTRERLAYKKETPITVDDRIWKLLAFNRKGAELKEEIRGTGLALSFLRGRRYWTVERSAIRPVKVNTITYALGESVSREVIEAWLAEVPSAEEKAAYDAYLKAADEKALSESRARSAANRRAA